MKVPNLLPYINASLWFPIRSASNLAFVPAHKDPNEEQLEALKQLLNNEKRPKVLVVTGAGISTESGLQDYRSEGVGLYARSNKRPTTHMNFIKSSQVRKSYWARSYVGWTNWALTQPNSAHKTLATWERCQHLYKPQLTQVITQNVDQLHFKAGSANVIELHGTLSVVKCQNCSFEILRHPFQNWLSELNPHLALKPREELIRPDGDVELSKDDVDRFQLPNCPKCHSDLLKPDVIFFGDNVPKLRVQKVRDLVSDCDILLIIGSSLDVYSGYRIVLQAKEENKKVAILNIGPTRADKLADIKVSGRAGLVLSKVIETNSNTRDNDNFKENSTNSHLPHL